MKLMVLVLEGNEPQRVRCLLSWCRPAPPLGGFPPPLHPPHLALPHCCKNILVILILPPKGRQQFSWISQFWIWQHYQTNMSVINAWLLSLVKKVCHLNQFEEHLKTRKCYVHHDLFLSLIVNQLTMRQVAIALPTITTTKISKVLAIGTGFGSARKRAGWCMPVHDRNLLSPAYFNSMQQFILFVNFLYLYLPK